MCDLLDSFDLRLDPIPAIFPLISVRFHSFVATVSSGLLRRVSLCPPEAFLVAPWSPTGSHSGATDPHK